MTRLHYANIITVAPAPAASTPAWLALVDDGRLQNSHISSADPQPRKRRLKVVEAEGNDGNAIRAGNGFRFVRPSASSLLENNPL